MQSDNTSLSDLDAEPSLPRERSAWVEAEVGKPTVDLRQNECMLAESQRLARIGSFELDVATRRLVWTEQQFLNFGMDPAPEIDRAIVITRIHPLDLERHEAAVQGAIEAGKPFTIDYRVVHPGGQVRNIHTVGRPIFDEAGRVVKLVGTSQDVTERMLLEDQLRTQYEQLKRLGELKANFVNSVTHELRTPLTTILGYAEFLEAEIAPRPPDQRRYISQIQRGAKRIEYLLNDLLDFACMEAGTFVLRLAPTCLDERVHEVVESLRPQAEEAHLAFKLSVASAPCQVELDAQRICQVLTNLVSNAIKFAPAGTTIRIATFTCNGRIRCEVEDGGPGIPTEDLPKLFQRFTQLDAGLAKARGTGLGLSISKALVEAHGGTIGVRSKLGVGSTFWFELPL